MTAWVEYTDILHPLGEPTFTTWPDGKVTCCLRVSPSAALKFDTPRDLKQLAVTLLSAHDQLEDAQRAVTEHAPLNQANGVPR